MKTIRMKTIYAGPHGSCQPDGVISVDETEAKAIVDGKYAEYVEQPAVETGNVNSAESSEEGNLTDGSNATDPNGDESPDHNDSTSKPEEGNLTDGSNATDPNGDESPDHNDSTSKPEEETV